MVEETISKGEPLPADVIAERTLQELMEGKAIKFVPGKFLRD